MNGPTLALGFAGALAAGVVLSRRGSAAKRPLRWVNLFSGVGGTTFGLKAAGISEVVGVEWDAEVAQIAQASGHEVVVGDVRDPSVPLLLDEPGMGLWASPPCQDWSTSGKRLGPSGERNGWPWTLAVIDEAVRRGCKPQIFIAENVPGMLQHRTGSGCRSGSNPQPDLCSACWTEGVLVPELRKRFRHVGHRVLDAADYGTPQRRSRLIFAASDARPFDWPEPTHSSAALARSQESGIYWQRHGLDRSGTVVPRAMRSGNPDLEPWRTARDVLSKMLVVDGRPIEFLRHEGGYAVAESVDLPSRTLGTKGTLYGWVRDPGVWKAGEKEIRRMGREGKRRITAEETALLQGFPPEHPVDAALTKAIAYRAAGNAVPPQLVEALARAAQGAP